MPSSSVPPALVPTCAAIALAAVLADTPAAPEQVTVSVAPTVVVSGERMAPGFSMHVRF